MMKSLISIILCIALCLSISVFSAAAQEVDLSAFETVGEIVYFGQYEQDNDLSNGKEPIEWIVLDVQDGMSMLLSSYLLDVQPFDTTGSTNVWKDSSIRRWLNNSFISEAFSNTQYELIQSTVVDNSSSQDYFFWSSGGSENTVDKVFLLSYSEVQNLLIPQESYFIKCVCDPTAYAENNPELTKKRPPHSLYYLWWTRSPALQPTEAMFATNLPQYPEQTIAARGIRPAIVIDLDLLAAHPEYLDESPHDELIETPASSTLIWGQEYTNGELTYSFVQEGTLSYYSLRGKDSNTLVNAVTSNAIPGTEKINQKIQEIMQACNYEATEGELDGVRTELYGSQESDAFVMATYGDWGVNMMLFVDGSTGIANYFSGTITTEDEAKPSLNGSLFGSAMQEAKQDTSKTRQFSLTAKEYIDAFNKQYGNMGMTLVPDSSRDDCHLAIRGEPTDIRIQFCDKINGPWTTGSGLDMKEWNWLYAYIATDDYSVDVDYFASFPMMCSFFAAIVGCDYTQEEFMDNCNASGPNGYPILTYTKNGIKNEIQFRDASVGNYHQTVYSASVELVQ